VRAADRSNFFSAIAPWDKVRLIREALIHDGSKAIDKAVRNLLVSTKDDDLALACMERLVGRRYDADIERYCKRRLPALKGRDKKAFQEKLDQLGWTPLHVAVSRGRLDLVQPLLAAGCRADAGARNGDTPLHLAARAGDEPMLSLLLSRKANLDGKGGDGLTPAQLAIQHDHDAIALRLLKQGCRIPDVLVAAVAARANLVARFLPADSTLLEGMTNSGRTPLLLAVRHGRLAVVRTLLGCKVDAAASVEGWSPLHEAAALGHAAIARLLLTHGARVDAQWGEEKFTPLHLAAHKGHTQVVRLLLEKEAKVDRPDAEKRSALFHAALRGHEAVIQLLLKHKANPRGARKGAPCPLHAAAGR
jgi:ankyrin